MAGVRDHTELDVWKLADALAARVRPVIDRPAFRRHEKLREQIEEAAESPCSNISEGFSRYLPRDNAKFVRVAAGSLTELITHLGRALARGLVTADEHAVLTSLAIRTRKAAVGYIVYLQTAKAPHLDRQGRPRRKRPKRRRTRTLNSNENAEPERER